MSRPCPSPIAAAPRTQSARWIQSSQRGARALDPGDGPQRTLALVPPHSRATLATETERPRIEIGVDGRRSALLLLRRALQIIRGHLSTDRILYPERLNDHLRRDLGLTNHVEPPPLDRRG